MAKKKEISQNDVIEKYIEYVLENNESPKSVFKFAKDNDFSENEFYNFYSSFESLEKGIFNELAVETIKALEKNKDYKEYEVRNKLLSFYFTFFENLTANRSFVVYALNKDKQQLKKLKVLSNLRETFMDYIQSLNIETIDLKSEKLQKVKNKIVEESAWIQLLMTMKFWLDDTSKGFEKTDIFIEKSVNVSFDLIDTTPLKGIVDFGKFLYKEKVNMK